MTTREGQAGMAGTFTVQQNLELLGRYRYTEIQLMELMGSWAHTMVDPEIKIGFGRHMFQDSVHADLLGKRIPELRGRSQHFHSIPPSDEFVKLVEFLLADQHPVGVYFKETKNA